MGAASPEKAPRRAPAHHRAPVPVPPRGGDSNVESSDNEDDGEVGVVGTGGGTSGNDSAKFQLINKLFPGKFKQYIDFKRASPFYKGMLECGLWQTYYDDMSAHCRFTADSLDNARVSRPSIC